MIVLSNPPVSLNVHLAEVVRLRREAERARAALDELSGRLDKAEAAVIKAMLDQGLTSIVDPVGNHATLGQWLWATPADEAAAFRWLRGSGHGDLIKRTIHGQSLSALVRELKAANVQVPECIHVITRPRLLMRRAH